MLKSKLFLIGGSVIGGFLLVYGSAIMGDLLMGNYILKGGLTDPNYIYLALLCMLPFVIGAIISSTNKTLSISGTLFAVLFVAVHTAFVYSGEQVVDSAITRMLIVLPISALLVIVATRIGRMPISN